MTASTATRTEWRIAGEEVTVCNCAWGCPCQFNGVPTTGQCEGMTTWDIQEGYFGGTRLDGTRFALICHWPGAVHEGNGTRRLIVSGIGRDLRGRRDSLPDLRLSPNGVRVSGGPAGPLNAGRMRPGPKLAAVRSRQASISRP